MCRGQSLAHSRWSVNKCRSPPLSLGASPPVAFQKSGLFFKTTDRLFPASEDVCNSATVRCRSCRCPRGKLCPSLSVCENRLPRGCRRGLEMHHQGGEREAPLSSLRRLAHKNKGARSNWQIRGKGLNRGWGCCLQSLGTPAASCCLRGS